MVVKEICLPAGTVLKNRYELVSVIGTGGFGITYQAVDRLLNCYVAVKEFFPQERVTRNTRESCKVEFPKEDKSLEIVEACLQNFRYEAFHSS